MSVFEKLQPIVEIPISSPDYPAEWKALPDAPPVIYARGNIALLKGRKFTVVGSRRTPAPALKLGTRVCKELSEAVAIVTGTADGGDGVRQGRMGMIEVLFDTVVLCSLTALVILVTGVCETVDASGGGMLLPLRAFSSVYGKSADYLLAVAVLCFSFATVICWGYYGECCLAYFTKAKWALALYRTLFSASVLLGAWLASSLIWTVTDVILGLMTGMNVLALLVLAPVLRQREKSASPEKEFLRVH